VIYFADDFMSKQWYEQTASELSSNEFKEVVVGDKSFYVQTPSVAFNEIVSSKISLLEGAPIKNILSFFRVSTDALDTDWRIHCDQKINGEQPDRAVVLFMSPSKSESELSGTAFWKHESYGYSLPSSSNEEFDRMLLEDSNDLSKWELNTVIGHKENRLISYPSSYFHSKYPNKSWEDGRVVFVMFYSHVK
tara:strand:+ start:697 stop:1272 length:576 start_codon:yes stop_codon:yes gene_type:complete